MADRLQGKGPDTKAPLMRTEALNRMLVLKIGLLFMFFVVVVRLVQIQGIDARKYQAIAKKQSEVKVTLPAGRGTIFDRNGTVLVSNMMMASLAADPKLLDERADAYAARLARVFEKPKRSYLEKLDPERRFVWLERRVAPQFARMVNVADFPGAVQLEEPRRLYHYEQLAGPLLGFTDVDNNGLSGIELEYNAALQGRDGYMIMRRDALDRRRASVDYPKVDPSNGRSIVLTIDLGYQSIAEEELRKGIERTKADAGVVVMLEPTTGEVLALASVPGVDPNHPSGTGAEAAKVRAVTDMFEPGSVFKVVTTSAILEKNLVKPDQKFFGEMGRYVVKRPNGPPRIITDTHPHGMLTLQEAVEQSSNIVMAKLSSLIGAELLYTTARDFGFGNETGIDIPGEVRGQLKKPTEWSGATLASMAYGYEVGVTPMQIAAAYAAVANKGVLMKPFVVQKILDEGGNAVEETKPQSIRRVIDTATARTLTTFLEGVVKRGTGSAARLDGVTVAGKTGTSRKVVDGKYELGNYTASFVGFFPSENPKVVCLVMLDNPRAGGYTGGLASAPIFHGIAQKVFATSSRFARAPLPLAEGRQDVVPDVTMLTAEAARSILAGQGFDVVLEGEGTTVAGQHPSAGARVAHGSSVTLTTKASTVEGPRAGYAMVPDLHGMSMRRAMNRLSAEQLEIDVDGSGVVTVQSPSPGTMVKTGSRVVLRCQPRPLPVN